MKPLLMAHQNVATIKNGILTVDRKFHTGMLSYAGGISVPIVTIHPQIDGQQIMDPVSVPIVQIPYQIETFKVDRSGKVLVGELPRLSNAIAESQLVYGDGLSAPMIARRMGIRYIPVLEYDLQTRTTVATAGVNNPVRRAIKIIRTYLHYRKSIDEFRHAHSLHCNGYPIYDATKRYNRNSLLYFDSRMSKDMLISSAELGARLARRNGPLQLLYSGRYEQMKGCLDVIAVAEICLKRGLDIRLHCYGQGSLEGQMRRLASKSKGRIVVHEAITYTELVSMSRRFDVFICCHIQNDPSCTYLESFGAGLPILGYANRMWERLANDSGAGIASTLGNPGKVAVNVGRLIADAGLLGQFSMNALAFAKAHCYEIEWGKRINALKSAIAE